MKVKICGITDLNSALFAVEQGVDALGFVFAESKRRISPEDAKKIIEQIPDHVLKVGVFVNEPLNEIKRIVGETGLTAAQLHGDESPQFCNGLSLPVIKAFTIGSKQDLERIDQFDCSYCLLDSPKGKFCGGNGVKFDWSLLADYHRYEKQIILAGGLNAENVVEAIQIVKPYMVDVSSGVETGGKKDLQKIKEFIAKAKGALYEEEVR